MLCIWWGSGHAAPSVTLGIWERKGMLERLWLFCFSPLDAKHDNQRGLPAFPRSPFVRDGQENPPVRGGHFIPGRKEQSYTEPQGRGDLNGHFSQFMIISSDLLSNRVFLFNDAHMSANLRHKNAHVSLFVWVFISWHELQYHWKSTWEKCVCFTSHLSFSFFF